MIRREEKHSQGGTQPAYTSFYILCPFFEWTNGNPPKRDDPRVRQMDSILCRIDKGKITPRRCVSPIVEGYKFREKVEPTEEQLANYHESVRQGKI